MLLTMSDRYEGTAKKREPHPDVGCWWTLYDYGPETVQGWERNHVHPYPGAHYGHFGKLQFCFRLSTGFQQNSALLLGG